jgi:hypothetical protein
VKDSAAHTFGYGSSLGYGINAGGYDCSGIRQDYATGV